jgi:tRNA threonylcarbamoyladenosine biosynthesis protein TsaB
MKLLTIDTSTNACSVALTSGGELVAEYLLSQGKTVSGRLLECVDVVFNGTGLSVTDLDGFGVALGPGSFTGLRIGVATVKGLALASGKPVAGFSSLAMLAMNLPWASFPVCPMFDARKGEVYTALYDCRALPKALLADCVLPPATFLDRLTDTTIFIGEGAIRYRELIEARLGDHALFAPSSVTPPRASSGALLAADALRRGDLVSLATLSPVYIRPSEAELAKLKREGV